VAQPGIRRREQQRVGDAGEHGEEGVCGACETRVISGLPDHLDSVLSDQEKNKNTVMMICVSGCKSELLELDL
jgi:hypothetical protein